MVITPLMSKARWLAFASLTVGLGAALQVGCGNGDGRPGSLVSSGGESGHADGSAGHDGGNSGAAGRTNGEAGEGGGDDAGAGAAGEGSQAAAPIAIFPQQLEVDVGCDASSEPTALVIQNGGILPLTIASASATAGYAVKTTLPLQIDAMGHAVLLLAAPTPKAGTALGAMSTGTLTFVTNEPESPSHEVLMHTTLLGGQFEFTDGNGIPLSAALPLTYLSSDTCPDNVKYRVHNTGNLAFTLLGPTFPTHFGGSSTGDRGLSVAPNGYAEFEVSGNSTNDGACSGGGDLTFTVQGSFCGAVPKLSVIWPTNVATTGCTCSAATD